MSSELEDCIVTFEQLVSNLEKIEAKLAVRLNLTGNIREKLIELDQANLLEEDELVADWHGDYASYLNSIEHINYIKKYIQDLSSASIDDDEMFHSLIKRSVSFISEKEMSHQFDMSRPSNQRWLQGTSVPHPRMRKHIYNFIIKKLEEELSK